MLVKCKPKAKRELIQLYLNQLPSDGRIVVYYDNSLMARDMIRAAGYTPVPRSEYRRIY